MNDLADRRPARLFTTFGTVLYIDPSGVLRHGPIESSPANAMFVALHGVAGACRSGSIVRVSGESEEPVDCSAELCQVTSAVEDGHNASGAITLELIALERGLIALRADGKFLSATPRGTLALARPVCSTWESFSASEAWCAASEDAVPPTSSVQTQFNVANIKKFVLAPLTRVAMNSRSKLKRILICGYPRGARGRVYYDLCKQLHQKGYIADILNFDQNNIVEHIASIAGYYDLFLTSADNVSRLSDSLGIPFERMVVITHHGSDARALIERKGVDVFDRFAAYGAVSDQVHGASLMQGVRRTPRRAPLGIDYAEFYAEVSTRLESVGSTAAINGADGKGGGQAEAAAQQASLPFKSVRAMENQAPFRDLSELYRSVDAVVLTSMNEAGSLSAMEAAAAGRLVIAAPVGHSPPSAQQDAAVVAPIEPEKFVAFAAATLEHYKHHPADFVFKCLATQEAARRFDWKHVIDDWVDLIKGG